MTIWKFDFFVSDVTAVRMPRGAQVLSVQVQHEQPRIWAIVDPIAPTETRQFRCMATGRPMSEDDVPLRFIDTIQLVDGDVVLHIFEELASP